MAGLATPVLATLAAVRTVRGVVNTVRGATEGDKRNRRERQLLDYGQAVGLNQLRAAQDEEMRGDAERRRIRAEQVAASSAEEERRRRTALRRAVSRTRAQLGAQGLSSADGSGEAILLGLVREAEEDSAGARRLDALRLRALDAEGQSAYRRNLLELTRLQERQRLERLARGY